MEHLIPSLAALLDGFAACFRHEVFQTFRLLVTAWAVCPGPHTISEVWQATGLAAKRHHDVAYALFHSARWDWDDLGKILVLLLVAHLLPTGTVWLVVDDTLAHKRGGKVAFGGFFLDAVTSTKRRKNFRFGLNWVVLGLAVHLPFRPDRYFCLPVVWRVYRKKGTAGYRKRTALAAELARLVAAWLPERECWLVGDAAYLTAAVLKERPANLRVLGPLRWDAALYALPPARRPGQRGPNRKKGDRLPTPRQMIEDTAHYPASAAEVAFLTQKRPLRVQVVRDVLWYSGAGGEPVTLVLVRDPAGVWRDAALLATAADVSAAFVVTGYCRRWGIEVAFFDSKQFLGLHEPRVWSARSVERAHPMAWFVLSLTVLWYAVAGKDGPQVQRERPWYTDKKGPTFADMLGALRLQLWQGRITGTSGEGEGAPEVLAMLVNWLSAVR
jgi:DDE superfamily endonuclease